MDPEEQSFQGLSQQAVVDWDSETTDRALEDNYSLWATVLNQMMIKLKNEHAELKKAKFASHKETVYGKTAALAIGFIEFANEDELKLVMNHILEGLVLLKYKGNERVGTSIRPSEMWEHFAIHYLRWLYGSGVKLRHSGGRADQGVDIEIMDLNDKVHSIVQVKRGMFFGKGGKGAPITREFFASISFSGVERGIIFTNESRIETQKEGASTNVIKCKNKGIDISFICIEDIKEKIDKVNEFDREPFREFIKGFIDEHIIKTIAQKVFFPKGKTQ